MSINKIQDGRINYYIGILKFKTPKYSVWERSYKTYSILLESAKRKGDLEFLKKVMMLGEALTTSYTGNLRTHMDSDQLTDSEKEKLTIFKRSIEDDLYLIEQEKIAKKRINILYSNEVTYPFWLICFWQYRDMKNKADNNKRKDYEEFSKRLGAALINARVKLLISEEDLDLKEKKKEVEEYLGVSSTLTTIDEYKRIIDECEDYPNYDIWKGAYDYYKSILNEAIKTKNYQLLEIIISFGRKLLFTNIKRSINLIDEEQAILISETLESCKNEIRSDMELIESERQVRDKTQILYSNIVTYPLWNVYFSYYKNLKDKWIKFEDEVSKLLASILGQALVDAEVNCLIPDEEPELSKSKKEIKTDLGFSKKLES